MFFLTLRAFRRKTYVKNQGAPNGGLAITKKQGIFKNDPSCTIIQKLSNFAQHTR